jgi:hypothetical protein
MEPKYIIVIENCADCSVQACGYCYHAKKFHSKLSDDMAIPKWCPRTGLTEVKMENPWNETERRAPIDL